MIKFYMADETDEKYRHGSPDNPLGWKRIERKCRLLAKECMDDGRADRIVELVKRNEGTGRALKLLFSW